MPPTAREPLGGHQRRGRLLQGALQEGRPFWHGRSFLTHASRGPRGEPGGPWGEVCGPGQALAHGAFGGPETLLD